jgi:hypothetical protein
MGMQWRSTGSCRESERKEDEEAVAAVEQRAGKH